MPRLATARLLLRQLTDDDLEVLARETSAAPQVSDAARRWAASSRDLDPCEGGAWALAHRITRRAVGLFTFFPEARGGACEISYMVVKRFRRRGLATEALAAALPCLLTEVGMALLFADVALDNTPSIRLLHRQGFTVAASAPLTVGLDRRPAERFVLANAGRYVGAEPASDQ